MAERKFRTSLSGTKRKNSIPKPYLDHASCCLNLWLDDSSARITEKKVIQLAEAFQKLVEEDEYEWRILRDAVEWIVQDEFWHDKIAGGNRITYYQLTDVRGGVKKIDDWIMRYKKAGARLISSTAIKDKFNDHDLELADMLEEAFCSMTNGCAIITEKDRQKLRKTAVDIKNFFTSLPLYFPGGYCREKKWDKHKPDKRFPPTLRYVFEDDSNLFVNEYCRFLVDASQYKGWENAPLRIVLFGADCWQRFCKWLELKYNIGMFGLTSRDMQFQQRILPKLTKKQWKDFVSISVTEARTLYPLLRDVEFQCEQKGGAGKSVACVECGGCLRVCRNKVRNRYFVACPECGFEGPEGLTPEVALRTAGEKHYENKGTSH